MMTWLLFLSLPNAMVRLALFPTAISVIVPSPKTLCLTLSPMPKSAIYLFLLIYANITRMANMMMTIICTGMPNNWENYLISPLLVLLSLWKQQWIYTILGNQINKNQLILWQALLHLLLLMYMNFLPCLNLTIKINFSVRIYISQYIHPCSCWATSIFLDFLVHLGVN